MPPMVWQLPAPHSLFSPLVFWTEGWQTNAHRSLPVVPANTPLGREEPERGGLRGSQTASRTSTAISPATRPP
eukprot:11226005-Lingulodinium_polyedra.AAC.1